MEGQEALLATARALEIDRVAAEVVSRLEAQGISTILIKGATLATWLYDDGTARPYVDSDVLVPPDRFGDAVKVLGQIGFRPDALIGAMPDHGVPHAEPFSRPGDGAHLDLHRTLSGASAAPAAVWEMLDAACENGNVGGSAVRVPTLPARAMLCAFHAAQHGVESAKPLEDLSRAVDHASLDTWGEAANLAAGVGGVPALAAGLRLTASGSELADRLDLPSERLLQPAATPHSRGRIAYGFERLAREKSLFGKAALLAREAFPPPAFMRWWSPLARRGGLGLIAAYGRRLVWLTLQAGPSFAEWRRDRHSRQPDL